MAKMTAEQFGQRVLELGLASPSEMQAVWSEAGTRDVGLADLQQYLLRRELLTNFQIERLLNGQKAGYFYGDYKVLYLVGSGTFARVYRASHTQNGRICAVKVLRRRFSDDREQTDRFYREGQIGLSLKHPNIVSVIDVYSREFTHFIAMEFVEGRNLREFTRARRRFSATEATKLMHHIARGLDHAFQRGVHHRDVKMSNVLVTSRGQAKLVDFGLASADASMSDDVIASLPNARSIDYVGLERVTDVRKDDARSDIFFLGCIYYHLLSGHPALMETKDRIQRLNRSRFRDIRPIHELSPELPLFVAMVVNRAMALDPSRRYQDPGSMLVDLKRAVNQLEGADKAAAAGNKTYSPDSDLTSREGIDEEGRPHTLMIVESDPEMQNFFRDRLKRNGYRVLVTADPQRALERFWDDIETAQLVLISSGRLGEPALETFNQLGQDPRTQDLPALLVLGESHAQWADRAQTASHRLVARMPVKLRQLRELLVQLLERREES